MFPSRYKENAFLMASVASLHASGVGNEGVEKGDGIGLGVRVGVGTNKE